MTQRRRFPPPWTVRKIAGGYVVQDAKGFALAYVYAADEGRRFPMPERLSPEEAERIARALARLPELWPTQAEG